MAEKLTDFFEKDSEGDLHLNLTTPRGLRKGKTIACVWVIGSNDVDETVTALAGNKKFETAVSMLDESQARVLVEIALVHWYRMQLHQDGMSFENLPPADDKLLKTEEFKTFEQLIGSGNMLCILKEVPKTYLEPNSAQLNMYSRLAVTKEEYAYIVGRRKKFQRT